MSDHILKLTAQGDAERPALSEEFGTPSSRFDGTRITVLHAVHRVWLELTQTWLYNQIIHLPPDVDSHVVCETKSNLDIFPFPSIHSLEDASSLERLWDRSLQRLRVRRHLGYALRCAQTLRPDVVHSHFGPTGWEFLPIAEAVGACHIVTFYGLDVNYLASHGWRERYRELFQRVDLVLCEGPHMRRSIAALGCPDDKIEVQRLGVPIHKIEFRPRSRGRGEPLRVLMAASFREKKGLPYAIEALGLLKRKLEIELTVIGGPGDSPKSRIETARIARAIERAGLGEHVRMMGFQPPSVLESEALRHHVFLAPSVTAEDGDSEGGAPVTLVEMAASGMPIVSTTHCDIPMVIADGLTGFLAPERNAAVLASRIEELVSRTEMWPAMLAAGRRRMEERFDARRQGELLARRYRRLSFSRRDRSPQMGAHERK